MDELLRTIMVVLSGSSNPSIVLTVAGHRIGRRDILLPGLEEVV